MVYGQKCWGLRLRASDLGTIGPKALRFQSSGVQGPVRC